MSKEPIDLMSVNIDQIVLSDKFNHNNNGSIYFIGYREGEFFKPLCIIFTSNEWVYKNEWVYTLNTEAQTCLF